MTVAAIGFGINEANTCVRFARAGDFDVAMMAARQSLLIQDGLIEFLTLALEKRMGVVLAGVSIPAFSPRVPRLAPNSSMRRHRPRLWSASERSKQFGAALQFEMCRRQAAGAPRSGGISSLPEPEGFNFER
jgi:hypothetical protein